MSCTRTSGDGGVGSTYRNVSKFAGREVELEYTMVTVAEPTIRVVGRNATTTSSDTIVVTPSHANGSRSNGGGTSDGCTVDYTAEFTFTGPARFLGPLMRPLLWRLANQTQRTLHDALAKLA